MTERSKYADTKFDQGISTIRNRITLLANTGMSNTSNSNKSVRTSTSNNNISNKLGALQDDCELLSQSVRESICETDGLRQGAKIIEDSCMNLLTKQRTDLEQTIKFLEKALNYGKMQCKLTTTKILDNCDRLQQSSNLLKRRMLELKARVERAENCLGLARIQSKII